MTEQELREPPLLSEEKIVLREVRIPTGDRIGGVRAVWVEKDIDIEATLKLQRDICIKWMKERCYLKAERELPECPYGKIMVTTDGFAQEIISYRNAQQDMLKEVDGVSFKAVREFEKPE